MDRQRPLWSVEPSKVGNGQPFVMFKALLLHKLAGMDVRPGSMGKAAPGYVVKIVDNNGREVETGEQGNIGIYCRPEKPPGLFQGYLGQGGNTLKKKTDECFAGDFYLTGDRAEMDKDGYIWFASRDDDIIISAGYKIPNLSPDWTESVKL